MLVNVLVIAGYGQDLNKIPTHREFVIESYEFGIRMNCKLAFAIGGATNPDFPERTEADATLRVISETFPSFPIPMICLGKGDTSADTLQEVKKYLEKYNYQVDELILASEMARSTGFDMDGLFAGLKEMTKGKRFILHGWRFPETD